MSAHLISHEGNIKIWSLLCSGDTRRIEALLGLYAELLPQYAHYVPRLRRRADWVEERRYGHIVHYWLVEVDGKPAAFHTFRYVEERCVGLSHALAVKPEYRAIEVSGQPLSMYLLHAALHETLADASRLGAEPPFGLLSEVEPSSLMDRYMQNGNLELPIAYFKPVFPAEQPDRTREEEIRLSHFLPTFLCILPDISRGIPFYSGDLIANFALAFLVDHYGLPLEHPQVRSVLDSIPPVFRRTGAMIRPLPRAIQPIPTQPQAALSV